jgi:hypothetical protein
LACLAAWATSLDTLRCNVPAISIVLSLQKVQSDDRERTKAGPPNTAMRCPIRYVPRLRQAQSTDDPAMLSATPLRRTDAMTQTPLTF